MRTVQFFLFLVTLPLLAAIGHDLYFFYENPDQGFKLSALGFLWTQYSPESYQWVATNLSEGIWKLVTKILTFEAAIVTFAIAAFVYLLTFIGYVIVKASSREGIGILGFRFGQKDTHLSILPRTQKKDFKYKKRG